MALCVRYHKINHKLFIDNFNITKSQITVDKHLLTCKQQVLINISWIKNALKQLTLKILVTHCKAFQKMLRRHLKFALPLTPRRKKFHFLLVFVLTTFLTFDVVVIVFDCIDVLLLYLS